MHIYDINSSVQNNAPRVTIIIVDNDTGSLVLFGRLPYLHYDVLDAFLEGFTAFVTVAKKIPGERP